MLGGLLRSRRLLPAAAAGIALLLFIETSPRSAPGDTGSRTDGAVQLSTASRLASALVVPALAVPTTGQGAHGVSYDGVSYDGDARAAAASDAGSPSWDTAVGRPGTPTCRVSHITGENAINARNITGSLGTKGNAYCHELCGLTPGCRMVRTQLGGDNMFGIVAWKLAIGKLDQVDVICDMLADFECEYPWFVSAAENKAPLQIAVANHTFELPVSLYLGPAGQHDAIVIAYAQGYRWEKAERFVVTLRGTGYKGQIHIAVSVAAINDPDWVKNAGCYDVTLFVPPNITDLNLHPQQKRWEEMSDRFEAMEAEWSLMPDRPIEPFVLILDIRDSFFQANPFGDILWLGTHDSTQVLLFPECLHHGQHLNSFFWMTKCWKRDKDRKFVPKEYWWTAPIICSGGFIGTWRGVKHVVKEMATEIRRQSTEWWCMDPNTTTNKNPGWDQGFLNHLYYRTERLQPVAGYTRLMGAGVGPLVHMSVFADWKLEPIENTSGYASEPHAERYSQQQGCAVYQDPEGYVVTYDAAHKRAAVVHQYDRLDPIDRLLGQRLHGIRQRLGTECG